MKMLRHGILLGLLVLFTGCGKENKLLTPTDIARDDLEALGNQPEYDLSKLDYLKRQGFEKLFGRSGADTAAFFNQRVKQFVSENSDMVSSKGKLVHTGWFTPKHPAPKSKGVVVGSNISAAAWLQGLLDDAAMTIVDGDLKIAVDSARPSVIAIGEPYTELENNAKLGVLLHEARHADCPLGISQVDLSLIRSLSSSEEFEEKFDQHQCSQMHVLCPTNHRLAGLPACDRIPWGSYTVSWLWQEASVGNLTPTTDAEWELDQVRAIDMKERLLFDPYSMLEGKLGELRLESQGLRE